MNQDGGPPRIIVTFGPQGIATQLVRVSPEQVVQAVQAILKARQQWLEREQGQVLVPKGPRVVVP